MPIETQSSFDWKVALYLFMGGTGGGLFFVGFLLERLGILVSLARVAEILGPMFVLGGSFFLLLHTGSKFKTKVHLLYLKPRKSWISRGTWIITIYLFSVFGYLFMAWEAFGWIALVFSLLVTLYPGFLLSETKGIPFWRNPVLPVLFLFSGLSAALAFIPLMAAFLPHAGEMAIGLSLKKLSWLFVFILGAQLAIEGSFLCMDAERGSALAASLRVFKRPLFVALTIVLGIVVPLLFHILVVAREDGVSPTGGGALVGALMIAGSMALRFSVVRAGVYLPRHSL